jgi:uncharacterized protein YceH (UPF0502 family)
MAAGGDVARLFAIFHRVTEAERRLGGLNARQDSEGRELGARLGAIEQRLAALEARFESLAREIAAEARAAATAAVQATVGDRLTALAVDVAALRARPDGPPSPPRRRLKG